MAARLEWKGDTLRIGKLAVARVVGSEDEGWDVAVGVDGGRSSCPYENKGDARAEGYNEVRRLLREAGVEVA